MFIINCFSDMIFFYFMSTHEKEKENFCILKDFVNWMSKKFDLKVKIIKSDNELAQKRTLCWLQNQKIDFKSSVSNIQDQNDVTKCSENVIMKKMCAIWISESLSHDFWKKIINCAVYLYNWIFQKAQN